MIEASQTGPAVIELGRRVQESEVFLRMAAIELRRIAGLAPEIADELRNLAQQLDVEANELVCRDAAKPAPTDQKTAGIGRGKDDQCFTLSK